MQRAMFDTVDEVGRVAAAEGIDVRLGQGRHGRRWRGRRSQLPNGPAPRSTRLGAWGFGAEDYSCLSADEARERVGATDVLGGTYTPHCASIHPARLVRGLAQAVERLGVRIYEGTPVDGDRARRRAHRRTASVRRRARRPGHRGLHPDAARATGATLAPVYSLMLATEPLPDVGVGADRPVAGARRSTTTGT